MPVGTYMIATAPLDPALCARLIPANAAACDNNFVFDYFRFSADHRLLFGGRVSYSTSTPRNVRAALRQCMIAVFPVLREAAVEFVWGGFVDISMNRAPDFGRMGGNVYYLQGFSGHGVAASRLAGRVVAEAIAGQAGRFDVFSRLGHARFAGASGCACPAWCWAWRISVCAMCCESFTAARLGQPLNRRCRQPLLCRRRLVLAFQQGRQAL